MDEIKSKIMELLSDETIFIECIDELDNWNGYADGFRAYPMCELDELCYGMSLSDFLSKVTKDFNLNDKWFYFSIYGIESTDDIYDLYNTNVSLDELFDELVDNYYHLSIRSISNELDDLLGEYIDN